MIYLVIPAVIAAAVIAADWLDWHGTLGPAWWLALPARLVMPHAGHHRDKYATAPAPTVAAQARRPGDLRMGVRAVRGAATPHTPASRAAASAGQAPLPDPGTSPAGVGQPPSPAPLSKALEAAPGAGAAGADPALPAPGQGRHPFRPVIMQFPGGEVGILGADGRWHIKPLAWQPGIRETGGMPALVRGPRAAFEAWQDKAVNVP